MTANTSTVYQPADIAFIRTTSVLNGKKTSYGLTREGQWFKRITTVSGKVDKDIPECQVPDSVLAQHDELVILPTVRGVGAVIIF